MKYMIQDHGILASRMFSMVRAIKAKAVRQRREKTDDEKLAILRLEAQAMSHLRANSLFGSKFLMYVRNG